MDTQYNKKSWFHKLSTKEKFITLRKNIKNETRCGDSRTEKVEKQDGVIASIIYNNSVYNTPTL